MRPHQISQRLNQNGGHRVQTATVERLLAASPDLFLAERNGRWVLTASAYDLGSASEPVTEDGPSLAGASFREASIDWASLMPKLYRWQVQALEAWAANGRRGIIQAVTGAGKTPVGIAATKEHLARGGRAVVVVPTIELMSQWRTAIAKWLKLDEDQIGQLGGGHNDRLAAHLITVAVAASAARYVPDEVRSSLMPVLLVADECHRYGAETYGRTLDAPYAATLGLSATPTRSDGETERTLIPAIGPIVYRLRYREALEAGVINPFEITFLALPFTPWERGKYDEYTDEISDRLDRLKMRYPQLDDTDNLFDVLEEIYERTQDPLIRALQGSVSHRQGVLHAAQARGEAVLELVRASSGQKVILFHERIEEADRLADELTTLGIPAASHHSQLTKVQRREVLRRFRLGFVRVLVAPRTLDEGIDVPDASLGVIVAGSKQVRQRIQRAGRILRTAPDKGVSRVVLFYVKDTVEDPRVRRDAEEFVAEIEDLGRAVWREWPRDKENLIRTLSGMDHSNPLPD